MPDTLPATRPLQQADARAGAAGARAGAFPTALHNLRQHLGPTLAIMVVLCAAITLFVSGLRLEWRVLLPSAAYSYAIGFCCWGLTMATRLALAAASDALARRRGRVPSPRGWGTGWRGMPVAMLAGVLLGSPLGLALGDALTGRAVASSWAMGSSTLRVTFAISLAAALLATWAISRIERLSEEREARAAAEREAAEAQLRLLQSQLEPHMLFNTLANLRVLIGLDAAAAQRMLDRLIAFLRATLEASRTTLHPLATEFARVDDYLALMAVRMGPRLQPVLELPAALREVPVPPLVLQPLVENAIQHGLEPAVAGGRLEVRARTDGERLVLTVRDTGIGLAAGAAATAGTGFGTTQVRERLATLYGPRASLELAPAADADGGVLATLTLPLNGPHAAPPP